MTTVRLTVGQAVVRFLGAQYSERDGVRAPAHRRLLRHLRARQRRRRRPGAAARPSCRRPASCPTTRAATSRRMVHAAVGYARHAQPAVRRCACTASVGPGATNMLTGAALATINRLPVLLLPSDIFATRVATPVLQELEQPDGVRRLGQRRVPAGVAVLRPGLAARAAAGRAARRDAGAHRPGRDRCGRRSRCRRTCRPRRYDWPVELFAERVWHVARPVPEPAALARAVEVIRGARRPLIVAGGGVIYAEATDGAARVRRGDRHPGRRDPGRQGLAAATTTRWPSARSARPARRRPTRSPARPTW